MCIRDRCYPNHQKFNNRTKSIRSVSFSGVHKRRTNTSRFNYLSDRRVLSMEEVMKDRPERIKRGGLIEGLRETFWNSGRYLWHALVKNEPYDTNSTEVDTNDNSDLESRSSRVSSSIQYSVREESPLDIRKHKSDASMWVLPNKKRRIAHEDIGTPLDSCLLYTSRCV